MRSRLTDSPAEMPYVQNWELFTEASWLLLPWKPSIISCLNIYCLLTFSSHSARHRFISKIIACRCVSQPVCINTTSQNLTKGSCIRTCVKIQLSLNYSLHIRRDPNRISPIHATIYYPQHFLEIQPFLLSHE